MWWRHKSINSAVSRGEWGENVATDFLRRNGFEIVDRNSRPYAKDHRLEIDVVAFDHSSDTMVFVEVKMHSAYSQYQRRLRSIDKCKRNNLRRACNAWRRVNRWNGGFRFDVVEVYGEPGKGKPVVDHITQVDLFAKKPRFVNWD